MGFGYVLASGRSRTVVAHDCDITTYTREMLARLCYPVAHPDLGFEFSKGFSARFSDRLNGRLMRLLFTPLLRSLQALLGPQRLLAFLDSFRYPLSGEICLDAGLLRHAVLPNDWGIEVGLLREVLRLCAPETICQVDLAERYDHKHRELSPDDPGKGLNKMAREVVQQIFHILVAEGLHPNQTFFADLGSEYARRAADAMRFSAADAALNGLVYSRADEELAVATFAQSLRTAESAFQSRNAPPTPIPSWNSITDRLPDFLPSFLEAARLDQADSKSFVRSHQ